MALLRDCARWWATLHGPKPAPWNQQDFGLNHPAKNRDKSTCTIEMLWELKYIQALRCHSNQGYNTGILGGKTMSFSHSNEGFLWPGFSLDESWKKKAVPKFLIIFSSLRFHPGSRARASRLAHCSLLIAGSADPWSCHSQWEAASSLLLPNLTTFLMSSGDHIWKWSHGLITAVQRLSSPTEVLRELKQNALKRWHCQAKKYTVVLLAQDAKFPHQHLGQLRNERNTTPGPNFPLPFISFSSA